MRPQPLRNSNAATDTSGERAIMKAGGLANLSFGFFGIQIGFALQNANASRIFQVLGTPIENLGFMWIAAPLTGLLVQPLVGHYSDRTWGRFGRRRPYFLAGAVLATLALIAMPNAGSIVTAALCLWLLDAALNVSMEPFRAFVGDMLRSEQRPAGYAFQTAFIGAGAVIAYLAPWALDHWAGASNVAPPGQVPASVCYAMYVGAAALFLAVLWTILSTREYPPSSLFESATFDQRNIFASTRGPVWIAGGIAVGLLTRMGERFGYLPSGQQTYLVAAGLICFGCAQLLSRMLIRSGRGNNAMSLILSDLARMPDRMRSLALVQFLTWGAMIILWVYATPVIAQRVFGSTDPNSAAYNAAGNWVGVLFATYSGVATAVAFILPVVVRYLGPAHAHALGLACGALAFVGVFLIRDAQALLLPMVGMGIAWASILSLPYVMLADSLPQSKLGVYMGVFNFFIVLPQLLVATLMGGIIKAYFPAEPAWTMVIAAGLLAAASAATLRLIRV